MDRRWYDLDVQTALSDGADSVADMAQRADRLGFTGIAIADHVTGVDDINQTRDTIEAADTGIDVGVGANLRPADGEELKNLLRQVRDHVDVVVVHGGKVSVNRAACGDTRVDVLAHPERKRKDSGIDHVMAKQAGENRVAIQLNVRQLLETRGKVRSHVLTHMRRNVRLCQKFDTPIITSSGAQNVHQLRAPRDMAAIPQMLGVTAEEHLSTVSDTPKQIIDRADQVHNENTVQPGVRTVPDEERDSDE